MTMTISYCNERVAQRCRKVAQRHRSEVRDLRHLRHLRHPLSRGCRVARALTPPGSGRLVYWRADRNAMVRPNPRAGRARRRRSTRQRKKGTNVMSIISIGFDFFERLHEIAEEQERQNQIAWRICELGEAGIPIRDIFAVVSREFGGADIIAEMRKAAHRNGRGRCTRSPW